MFCTHLRRVGFDVYLRKKNVSLYVETVMFDEIFWQQFLQQMEFFFRSAVVPELFTHRVQNGEQFYQYGIWKNKQEKIKTAILIAMLHKKHFFPHVSIQYLLRCKLVSIDNLTLFIFYGSRMNLN